MINYHNIVFPFLHRHGCRQEADSRRSSVRLVPS